MRKAKQLLSCLLVLLMVFSLAPQVFAYEDWNIPGNSYPAGQSLYPDRESNYFPNQQPDEYYEWIENYNQWQQAGGHTHEWSTYSVVTPASCTAYGESVAVCLICRETKNLLIPKLAHFWGEWEIIFDATDHSAGSRRHTCRVCGTVEEEPSSRVHTAMKWKSCSICWWKTAFWTAT